MSRSKSKPGSATKRAPAEPLSKAPRWALGVLPLVALGALLVVFVATDPLKSLRGDFPAVEELTIERAVLKTQPREIVLTVRNGGPDPVEVAQVLVDEAYWNYDISPDAHIERLGRATLHIPYPWVEGEAHEVVLLSSTGVAFAHEIAVAVETPETTGKTLWTFTLLGIFVGVIPVFLGLTWLPFVRRLPEQWVRFFLALTAGLLVFLAVDALDEALETAGNVPGAFQGVGLIVIGVVGALAALYALDGWLRSRRRGEASRLYVALLIAVGIGLHNLGEGLAIGAAYALGEVGLTAFLILGFTMHNVTEGLGIVTPLSRERPSLRQLAGLGAIAGVPTILGTYSGGLAYSPIMAVLFLSIGAGAIVQVVWELGKLLRGDGKQLSAPLNAVGFTAGILVMYLTGLAVAA
ncbi:MAG TPA: metal transporter [Actinomycetota bacterium]|jgi:zinc transporter ZupT|nr:metal transporter [Actinomycetota bacterium]